MCAKVMAINWGGRERPGEGGGGGRRRVMLRLVLFSFILLRCISMTFYWLDPHNHSGYCCFINTEGSKFCLNIISFVVGFLLLFFFMYYCYCSLFFVTYLIIIDY